MKQAFTLNGNENILLEVVKQRSLKYDAMTIQISAVLDFTNIIVGEISAQVGLRYVYEEINNYDEVIYARYMGYDNIRKSYSWFFQQYTSNREE